MSGDGAAKKMGCFIETEFKTISYQLTTIPQPGRIVASVYLAVPYVP